MTQLLTWTPTGMVDTITQGSDVTGFGYTADDQRTVRHWREPSLSGLVIRFGTTETGPAAYRGELEDP